MTTCRSLVFIVLTLGAVALPAAATTLDAELHFGAVSDRGIGERFEVRDVPLESETGVRLVDLDLERFDVLTDDALLVVGAGPAARRLPAPRVVLLRGTLRSEPATRVFLGIAPAFGYGFIDGPDGVVSISTGAPNRTTGPGPLRLTAVAALPFDPGAAPFVCPTAGAPEPAPPATAPLGGPPPCRVARLAVETDWEFTQLFEGDPESAAAYAITLFAANGEIFREQLELRIAIGFLRVYETSDDPWDADSLLPALAQFQVYWNQFEVNTERDLAHFLSGRPLGGGAAFVSGVCSAVEGYGISSGLNGFFPYPREDFNPANWDLFVTTHELGHGFGTPHTHEYAPPLDFCGLGNCNDAFGGTIMSYCHLCPGGIGNIRLGFHPAVIAHILNDLENESCDLEVTGASALEDRVRAFSGQSVVVDVLRNDETVSCDAVSIVSFDAMGSAGGAAELVPADGTFPRDRIRVTPAATAGGEIFAYSIGVAGADIRVDIEPLRAAEIVGATADGLDVSYYALSLPGELPDFDGLFSYLQDVVPAVDYPATDGPFATGLLSDQIGAVFEGYVLAPEPGLYTFFVESDEGSALYVGDDLILNNDGLHDMRERSGQIGLEAGLHRIRLEYFEAFGPAGLILRWAPPGAPKETIPVGALKIGVPCPADVDGTGAVGFGDVMSLLSAWGACPGCVQDVDGNGVVDARDLMLVLSAWGPC